MIVDTENQRLRALIYELSCGLAVILETYEEPADWSGSHVAQLRLAQAVLAEGGFPLSASHAIVLRKAEPRVANSNEPLPSAFPAITDAASLSLLFLFVERLHSALAMDFEEDEWDPADVNLLKTTCGVLEASNWPVPEMVKVLLIELWPTVLLPFPLLLLEVLAALTKPVIWSSPPPSTVRKAFSLVLISPAR